MELTVSREIFLKLTNDEIIDLLNSMFYFNIYSVSNSWRSSSEYILKARGKKGDILLIWNDQLSWDLA